jgi:hypothetical protein
MKTLIIAVAIGLMGFVACGGLFAAITTAAHAEQVTRPATINLSEKQTTPAGKLAKNYQRYIIVQGCYKVRDGYLAVYINDVEMDRARRAITDLEKLYTTQDPVLVQSSGYMFRAVSNAIGSAGLSRFYCQAMLSDLLAEWSNDAHNSDFAAQKDFGIPQKRDDQTFVPQHLQPIPN